MNEQTEDDKLKTNETVAGEAETTMAVPAPGLSAEEIEEVVEMVVEKDVDDSSDPAVEVTEPVLEEPEEVSEPVVEEPEEVAPVVKSFNITAKKFEFTPSSITVNEGDIVRITISSSDVSHGFSIPQFGVSKIIPAGGTVTVEFTADKKGSYKFFCIVFCGSGHGSMRGTLVVQ